MHNPFPIYFLTHTHTHTHTHTRNPFKLDTSLHQSHVYVYARLLERGDSWGGGGGGASRLRVHLTPERLSVSLVHAGGGGGGGSKMPGSQPLPLPAAAGGDGGAGGPRTGPLAEAGSFRDDEDDERVEEEEAEVLFGGRLFAAVKAELSTWFVGECLHAAGRQGPEGLCTQARTVLCSNTVLRAAS